MPLQFLPAFSGSCCVKSWQNNPILAFLVQCFDRSKGKSLCRTLQGLRDLFYLWEQFVSNENSAFQLRKEPNEPKDLDICSESRIDFKYSSNIQECLFLQEGESIPSADVQGRGKERGKKRVGPSGWIDNGLSARVIMTLNLPRSQWLKFIPSSSQH